jgi:exonuclease SbcD
MTFRVLHSSDWHLGQHFYGKSRANEHQQFLNWLLQQVKQHDIDAVIVAGDIFDTGTPPSYAREMYFDFIVNMNKLNCQLVILAGNHDSVAMLGESKQLLSHLSCTVIPSVSDDINKQVISLKNKAGEVSAILCAIPFIRPRDVVVSSSGQTAKHKQQSLQQGISEHYQLLYQQAEILAKQNDGENTLPIIATGHLTTVGVTTSESVRDIYIGTLEAFPANAFPPADYIALGHIHRSQKVAKTDHIRYCGSPIPLSFDEAGQDKNVLLAEFSTQNSTKKLMKVETLVIPCFQPLVMIKTGLDTLATDVEKEIARIYSAAKNLTDNFDKIWLDIEIDSAEYLQDLTPRIEDIIKTLPVEILLVRRSKKSRQSMPNNQTKITLNELSLIDVFTTRLEQEHWQTDKEIERKGRLNNLFLNAVEQAKQNFSVEESADGERK